MGKVEDTVDKFNELNDISNWDSGNINFKNDEDKEMLEALAKLNGDEFAKVIDKVDEETRINLVEDADEKLLQDPKYKNIIYGLSSGNAQPYKDQKAAEAEPEFRGHGWENRPKDEKHVFWVDLYEPKGASDTLKLILEDTEFTMQWGIDTLGARNPKAAPEFNKYMAGDKEIATDNWAQLVRTHGDLSKELSNRQENESQRLKGIEFDTNDTALLGHKTFKALTTIIDELNEHLKHEITGLKHTGNQLTENSGGRPENQVQVPVFEKNTNEADKGREGSSYGKYVLTPEAEQRYYIRHIDEAVDKWEKAYATAAEEFRKKANNVDDKGGDKPGDKGGDKPGDKPGDKGGNGQPDPNFNGPTGNGTPQDNGAPKDNGRPVDADTALEDLDKEFSNILEESPEKTGTEGTGSDPLGSAGGPSGGTGGKEDKDAQSTQELIKDYLNGGTGQQQGGATQDQQPQNQQPQNQAAGGFDPMSFIMPAVLSSALPSMLNGNKDERDDRKDDEDERRERDQQAPGPAQQSPGTAVTPDPGAAPQNVVTASTDAGPPPIVNTPGMNADHKLPGEEKPIKVPQTVSDALSRQQGNPAVNATTAYAETAAAQDADSPWREIDVSELRVGDVIKWENHSAVLFQKDGGWHYVIGDQVTPLDTQNLDSAQFGKFERFLHPTGLDSATTNAPAPEPSKLPEPKVSQTAPADPPAVQPPREV